MEGWPRIPNQGVSSSSRPKATIPSPGTVVMASVEEDLGDGMYSFRWGGNRIAVSSRSPLKPGQSLILKSETNAEGKPTLVVQGPALPEPGSITGRVIYGPGKNRAHTDAEAKKAATAETHDARAGQTPGGQVAAGTAKGTAVQAPTPTQPIQNLVGLVLEPLPELEAGIKVLVAAVKEEKERLEEKEKSEAEGEDQADELQDEDAPKQEKNIVLDRRERSAAGGRAGPGPLPLTAEAPDRPAPPAQAADQFDRSALTRPAPQSSQPPAPVVPETPAAPPQGQQATADAPRPAPQPAQPQVQPNVTGPTVPDVPATLVQEQQRPAETAQPATPQPQMRPEAAGPAVPDVPATPVQNQQLPADSARPVQPQPQPQLQAEVTRPAVPDVPAAPVQSQQPPAEASRPVPPQPPVQPDASGQSIPATPAEPRPAPPQPAQPPLQPGAAGPTVPDIPAVPVQGQQPPAEAPRPVLPQPPVQPDTSGQSIPATPAEPRPAQSQPAQPPLQPGAAGPIVPDVPAVPVQGRQPSAEAPRPVPPQPAQPVTADQSIPAAPAESARPLPAQNAPQPQPVPPSAAGPVVPDIPATPAPAQPQQTAQPEPQPQQPAPPPTEQARPQPPPAEQPPPPQQPQPSETGPVVPVASPRLAVPAPTPPTVPPPAQQDAPAQPVPAQPQPLPGSGSAPSGATVLPAETGPVVSEPAPSQPQPAPSGQQPPPPADAAAPTPPPRQDASSSTRRTGVYGPPRSDTDAIRQRQATLPAAANSTAETGDKTARTEVQPEIFLKEALTQMVKAAELPLGGDAQTPALAVAAKPPQAVVDKAADLFLRAAGFEPDEQTLAAARALVRHSVPVDRDNVQAMLDATVDTPAAEQEAALNATARLLAKDIPVSPPLVAGLADVLDRRAGTHAIMQQVMEALSVEADVPEAQALMDDARQLLDMLHVDLGREDAGAALERYLSTFGREALGKALALVETSAQAVLESSPELQRLDKAIAAVLTELTGDMAQTQQQELGPEGLPEKPNLSLEQLPPVAAQPLPAPAARPLPAINAYLNAPRAFNVAEALKNLPPMPKLVSINAPIPQEMPAVQPLPGQPAQGQPPQGQAEPQPEAKPQQQQQPLPPSPAPMPTPGGSSLMAKLDSLFQIPGLNRPEFELLRPSGFMERFLATADGASDSERTKSDARALLRQLTSENADVAEKAMKDLKSKSPEVLKETAARLNEREAEVLRNNNVMSRLADAATSLRDLGRQLIAVKAENLAGQDREPGVMLAEVPFKLNDDAGDGRMQMFYRKSKKKEEGWSSRVILDLNTTRMGPVLGDMRFFGQDMVLNMFVERQDTADYLGASAADLVSGLADKGFRVKARFMVLPPRRAPELHAERPVIAGEETHMAGPDGDHKLDIKG